jgi:translation initiation factor 1
VDKWRGACSNPGVADNRLVYSTDPALKEKCPKCKELLPACTCPKETAVKSRNFVAVLRIEKQGRGGKTVTVIDGLPKIALFLKDLTKQLKNACGAGGTFSMDGKEGLIEIQGDKREQIRTLLKKSGITVKG